MSERIWTAGLVVIGDEILSGRTHDKNIAQVAEWLQVQGIRLDEVRVVPDVEERIVEAVREVEAGAAPINGFIAGRVLTLLARLASPGPDYGLTPREHDTLELLVAGLTMKEVAARMGVSYHTVDTHVRHVYAKLQVRSRGGAVAKALRERIV